MKDEVLKRGKFYIIGTGPAGPKMATLQALNTIKKMDVILASYQDTKLFEDYIGEKPVLFDPWEGFWDYEDKHFLMLNKDEMENFRARRFHLRDERVEKIKELLNQGKDVALLDSGNPCFFGPSHWYVEQFDQQDITIIPGMGCEAAALAALGKSIIPSYDTRFVMQTAPLYLRDWDQILEHMSKYPVSMVTYMVLKNPEKLFDGLKKVCPADMPCAAVYWAGFPEQHIVRGTVADMGQKLSGEKEDHMGILFIGRFLDGKPYEAAMKQQ